MKEERGLDAGRPNWGKGRCGISNSNLQTVRAAPEEEKCSLYTFRLHIWLFVRCPSLSPSQTLAHQEQSLQEGLEAQPCGLPLLWKDTQDNETVRPWMASSHCGGQSIGAFTSGALIELGYPQCQSPRSSHCWTTSLDLPALGQPGGSTEILCQEIPKIWAFKGYDIIVNELGLNPSYCVW